MSGAPSNASPESKRARRTSNSISRLYNDVLQSTFTFSSLQDLASFSRVSRQWNRVINCMQSIQVDAGLQKDLVTISASPLARHVGEIRILSLSCDGLQLLSSRLPALVGLDCSLGNLEEANNLAVSYQFPMRLQELNLILVHSILVRCCEGISHCHRLRTLELRDRSINLDTDLVSLESWQRLTCLTRLHILGWSLTVEQQCSVRKIANLTDLYLPDTNEDTTPEQVVRILATPTDQRLQKARFTFNDRAGVAIGSLTSLTHLTLFRSDSTHLDWLVDLKSLVTLNLYLNCEVRLDPERVCDGLASIPQLTYLQLDASHFAASHLTRLPVILPRLETLYMWGIQDVTFLASLEVLATTLTCLDLHFKDIEETIDILRPLGALIQLTRLHVFRMWTNDDRRVCRHAATSIAPFPHLVKSYILF
jgi:hypothetical protein